MVATAWVVATTMDATPLVSNGTTSAIVLSWAMDANASKCCYTIYGDNNCPSNTTTTYASSFSSMQQAIIPLVKSKNVTRTLKRVVKKKRCSK
jgi:hypothetical protein